MTVKYAIAGLCVCVWVHRVHVYRWYNEWNELKSNYKCLLGLLRANRWFSPKLVEQRIFIQVNLHASTVSWGSRASKAIYNCKQIDWLNNFSLFVFVYLFFFYSFSIYTMSTTTDFFDSLLHIVWKWFRNYKFILPISFWAKIEKKNNIHLDSFQCSWHYELLP